MRTTTIRHIIRLLLSGALLLSLASCTNDNYLDEVAYTDGKVAVEMSIQARSLSNNIKSSSETEYVPGTEWENYVDFANGDYRIYFFEYDPQTETGSGSGASSKLIASFTPTDIFSTDLDTYTTYTLSGELDEGTVESLTNFKVVVVANWGEGNYPSENDIADEFTIDKLCSYEKAVFSAFVDNDQKATMPSASNLIPFFGLREYSDVTWKEGRMTRLSGDITLLRSVAKVEVILEPSEGQEDISFSDVSIVNYNATGYCAPTGVYLRSDYDHNYTWDEDFVDVLHLVSTDTEGKGVNDPDQTGHTIAMYKTTNSEGKETWVAYVPEYDNMGDDFSYMQVDFGDGVSEDNYNSRIYFANYTEGSTTAYGDGEGEDKGDRYDIYRNYLYRYHVTVNSNYELRVFVDTWGDVFDNEWTFGFTTPEEVGTTFTANGIWYQVLTSSALDEDGNEVSDELTVGTYSGGTGNAYTGEVVIPSTILYYGYYYTVTEIGANSFDGHTEITSISIPSTVTKIGDYAFEGCAALTTLIVHATTPPECGGGLFALDENVKNITLYVPYGAVNVYKQDNTWSSFGFKEITAIED